MPEIPSTENSARVDALTWEVGRVYKQFKERIEAKISENYGATKEEEVLKLFGELWSLLSMRNTELVTLLKEKFNLDFEWSFDFSWGIVFDVDLLNQDTPDSIKSFFSKKYTRQEGKMIHSRGYWYYFNFPWLNSKWRHYELNTKEYLEHLLQYYYDTLAYLDQFWWKKISELSNTEKKLLLVWLEHYKNILLFFQNFLISVSNKEYLERHVLNISWKTFTHLFVDVSDNSIAEINLKITEEIEKVITFFWDISLWIDTDAVISHGSKEIGEQMIPIMTKLYGWSFQKQSDLLDFLKSRQGSRTTNIDSIAKSIDRWNNKLIGRLLRIIREEDNPVKELLACHNIAQNIPEDTKKVNVQGLLYWWIEMPYFMKYILTRFRDMDAQDVHVDLLWLSAYSNRNLKQTSTLNNYRPIQWDKKESKLQLVLDDNIYYWDSLQVASNVWTSEWPTYAWVAEVWLRRRTLGKLREWSNVSFILSKIPDSASVTPVKKRLETYRNLVSEYILKKLPGLRWNL